MHGELSGIAGSSQDPDLTMLLRWPGLVAETLADPEPLHEAALEQLETAAESLVPKNITRTRRSTTKTEVRSLNLEVGRRA